MPSARRETPLQEQAAVQPPPVPVPSAEAAQAALLPRYHFIMLHVRLPTGEAPLTGNKIRAIYNAETLR